MKRHLTAIAGPRIDKALEKHANIGETVVWEFAMVPVQMHPAQPPQYMLHLVFWMPGVVLDTVISSMMAIPDPLNISAEAADEMVLNFLRHLREQKSQALNDAMKEAEGQAGLNGNGAPSGLIIPGQ